MSIELLEAKFIQKQLFWVFVVDITKKYVIMMMYYYFNYYTLLF